MKKIYVLATAFCLMLVAPGCSKDDDNSPLGLGAGCGYAWSVRIADEAQALSAAAQAYGQDPTTENCEAYRKAYQDYLDEAEDIKPCVPAGEKDDFQDNIDEAREELNKLQC